MAFITPDGTGYALADGVATEFLSFSGSAVVASGYNVPTLVILGSAQNNSTTSFADVTGLSLSVAANTRYYVWFYLVNSTAATTTGIAYSWTVPAAATYLLYGHTIATAAATAVSRFGRAADTTAASASLEQTAENLVVGDCVFVNGANAGTLQLRFKSEVDTSQVSVLAGSFLCWQTIA